EVASFYDRDKYTASLSDHREQTNFGVVTPGCGIVLSMTMLISGGLRGVDSVLRAMIDNELLPSLAFFGVILLASVVLTMPFQWYATFVIEERYGFNRTTVRTFILDKLKGYALAALIGGGLLALLIYLINAIGPDFWIWFAVVASLFVL